MVNVVTTININQPQKEVFEYTVNPDNAPEWYENIKSVEWRTEKPLKKGSKIAFLAKFLGRKFSYVYEMVELIPSEKLIMRTDYGPFLMETIYQFDKINEKLTRVTLRNRGNPIGFSKAITPFMSLVMRHINNKDLRKLKENLEGSKF